MGFHDGYRIPSIFIGASPFPFHGLDPQHGLCNGSCLTSLRAAHDYTIHNVLDHQPLQNPCYGGRHTLSTRSAWKLSFPLLLGTQPRSIPDLPFVEDISTPITTIYSCCHPLSFDFLPGTEHWLPIFYCKSFEIHFSILLFPFLRCPSNDNCVNTIPVMMNPLLDFVAVLNQAP
jgi:hypothetical protein